MAAGKKKLILGEGPKNAKIMLVGESPGATEIKLGRPFVGRAGRFLNSHLKKIGVNRKKVYITNIVKERCIGQPTLKQIKKYLPMLKKELKKVRPKIIVLLGNTAKKYAPRIKGIKYIELPHPAAAMRFPKQRKIFERGIKRLI